MGSGREGVAAGWGHRQEGGSAVGQGDGGGAKNSSYASSPDEMREVFGGGAGKGATSSGVMPARSRSACSTERHQGAEPAGWYAGALPYRTHPSSGPPPTRIAFASVALPYSSRRRSAWSSDRRYSAARGLSSAAGAGANVMSAGSCGSAAAAEGRRAAPQSAAASRST